MFSEPAVEATPKPQAINAFARAQKWGETEISQLLARYPTTESVKLISADLARTVGSVRSKAYRLGLRRPSRHKTPENRQLEIVFGIPLPPKAIKLSRPFKYTKLGGREEVWSDDLISRLARLWAANFHRDTISVVLGVSATAVSSKANLRGMPARNRKLLSKDLTAAQRTDALPEPAPKVLVDIEGRQLIGKRCNLTGHFFYGPMGIRTSTEAKHTLYYQRLQGSYANHA